jgi:V/A-type H+-transporting ATPase subunit K
MIVHVVIFTLLLLTLLIMASRRLSPRGLMRAIAGGLLLLNGATAVAALGLAFLLWLGSPIPAQAASVLQQQEGDQQQAGISQNVAIGASLSTGLAAIGAGIAVGIASAAAIGAITEKPEVLGRTLNFVGLAEGIAIYGLIISFLILTGGFGGGGGGGG